MNNSFPKKEHLYGLKAIGRLHTHGKAFIAYPFRVVFLLVNDSAETMPVRVMVTVPKKKFKKAVDRNRLKRLMRETYRLNKGTLIETVAGANQKIHVSFQYIGDEMLSFPEIQVKMQKALEKLLKSISLQTKGEIEKTE